MSAAADSVKGQLESLKSQASILRKQLGASFSRAEGEGLAPPLPQHALPASHTLHHSSSKYGAHLAHASSMRHDSSSTMTSQYSPSHTSSIRGTSAWQAYSHAPSTIPSQTHRYISSTRATAPAYTSTTTRPASMHAHATTEPYNVRHASPGRPMAAHHSDIPHLASPHRTWPAAYPTSYPHAATGAAWSQPHMHHVVASRHSPGLDEGLHGHGCGGGGVAAAGLVAREESRLREMLQEVRHERRRLEDKILSGDSQGIRLQELRDELERQVGALSRQRDGLEAETGGMANAQQAAAGAEHEVLFLREALAAEQHAVGQLQSARGEMEGKLSELAVSIDSLASQHAQAVAGLTSERDTLSAKHAKALNKLTKTEGDLAVLRGELETLKKEVHARELALAEVRASAEVLQAASSQMQAQLSGSKRELEGRCHDLTRQLDEARQEGAQAHAAATRTQAEWQETSNQLKESLTRSDFLRSERDKLLRALQGEQATAAELRKQLEAANAQASVSEASRVHVEHVSRQEVEALHREHDTRMAAVTRQFEAQLAAADKAAAAAVKQHDSSTHTGEKLLEVHAGLRRERDELWHELEGLRAELAETQQERDQLASKVGLLRSEVKATMDDVRGDREARLIAAAQQHDYEMAQVRAHYEGQAAAAADQHGAQIRELMEMVTRLKVELADAQRSSDKYKSTVSLLRDQLAEALVLRDNLDREVAQERAYGEELGRLVAEMKAATRGIP